MNSGERYSCNASHGSGAATGGDHPQPSVCGHDLCARLCALRSAPWEPVCAHVSWFSFHYHSRAAPQHAPSPVTGWRMPALVWPGQSGTPPQGQARVRRQASRSWCCWTTGSTASWTSASEWSEGRAVPATSSVVSSPLHQLSLPSSLPVVALASSPVVVAHQFGPLRTWPSYCQLWKALVLRDDKLLQVWIKLVTFAVWCDGFLCGGGIT